jgi:hypothetical protein
MYVKQTVVDCIVMFIVLVLVDIYTCHKSGRNYSDMWGRIRPYYAVPYFLLNSLVPRETGTGRSSRSAAPFVEGWWAGVLKGLVRAW